MLNFYTSLPAGADVSLARPVFSTSWKMRVYSHTTYDLDGKPIFHYTYSQKNDIWQAPVNGIASPVPKPYNESCGYLSVYREASNLNLWKIFKTP